MVKESGVWRMAVRFLAERWMGCTHSIYRHRKSARVGLDPDCNFEHKRVRNIEFRRSRIFGSKA